MVMKSSVSKLEIRNEILKLSLVGIRISQCGLEIKPVGLINQLLDQFPS